MQRVLPSLRHSSLSLSLSTRALSSTAARNVLRVSEAQVPRAAAIQRAAPSTTALSSYQQQRRFLQASKKGGDASYAEIKAMSQQPTEVRPVTPVLLTCLLANVNLFQDSLLIGEHTFSVAMISDIA